MEVEIPLITRKIMKLLELNYHNCAVYKNGVLEWCNNDECKNKKNSSHLCLDTYPIQVI